MKFVIQQNISVKAPANATVKLLQNVAALARYEPKVDAVVVYGATPQQGELMVQGRCAGLLPWRGVFSYALHRSGFYSEMKSGPRGVKMQGGFLVQANAPANTAESCCVTRYERYELSGWLRLLGPLLRWWLCASSQREARQLAHYIEKSLRQNSDENSTKNSIVPAPVWTGCHTTTVSVIQRGATSERTGRACPRPH